MTQQRTVLAQIAALDAKRIKRSIPTPPPTHTLTVGVRVACFGELGHVTKIDGWKVDVSFDCGAVLHTSSRYVLQSCMPEQAVVCGVHDGKTVC